MRELFCGNMKILVDMVAQCAYLLINKDGEPQPRRDIMNASTARTATVLAYSPETRSSRAVIQQREGQRPLALLADLDDTFTVERCRTIFNHAQRLDTRTITGIRVIDIDRGREYRFDAPQNRLTIWENDLPIYENWDGVITRDRAALEDCLM